MKFFWELGRSWIKFIYDLVSISEILEVLGVLSSVEEEKGGPGYN